jgi:hypothetical protein
MAKTKEELIALRDAETNPKLKEAYQIAIDRLEIKNANTDQSVIATAMAQVSKVLAQAQMLKTQGVDELEVIRIFKEQLSDAKIGIDNLEASLRQLLQNLSINATINIGVGQKIITFTTTIDPEFLTRPLTQLILSDVSAKNNVFLYGGAGTGKTYTAGEIANLLGWTLVEVNCNQFTSPLDLLGGQTISGYQEGLVSQAWSNVVDGQKVDGCVLLLDELPKIDPNTAGILNSALAKVKLEGKRARITNGRGEKLDKGNILIIGTGNTKLNETSEDYEANFKQDLSLQDRFIGSTYEIFVYYSTEVTVTMKGFLFIWLYAVKLREYVEEKKLTNRAFVSIRLMENLRDTYIAYRTYDLNIVQPNGKSLVEKPKTLAQGLESFFSLFPKNIADDMKTQTQYSDFADVVAQKNAMPIDVNNLSSMNFDTQSEINNALKIAEKHDKEKSTIYFI